MDFWHDESYKASLSIYNFFDGYKSLSGFEVKKDDFPPSIYYWFECFRDIGFSVFEENSIPPEVIQKYIERLCTCNTPGDLPFPPSDELYDEGAFLIILIDRLLVAFKRQEDGWECMDLLHQAYECMGYIQNKDFAKRTSSQKASNAARARHKEHYDLKEDAREFYREHGSAFKSKAAAARAIAGKVVPINERTAYKWVTEFTNDDLESLLDNP